MPRTQPPKATDQTLETEAGAQASGTERDPSDSPNSSRNDEPSRDEGSRSSHQPRTSSWVVLKFGGTSVSSGACWETIAKVLRDRVGAGLRPLVVCSALSQVSNQLEQAVAEALEGQNPTERLHV